jgi:hypothetical protein
VQFRRTHEAVLAGAFALFAGILSGAQVNVMTVPYGKRLSVCVWLLLDVGDRVLQFDVCPSSYGKPRDRVYNLLTKRLHAAICNCRHRDGVFYLLA